MNRYTLIKGFDTYDSAKDYADRLPKEAIAKVAPYSDKDRLYLFAVDVIRSYTGGRL